MTLAKISDTRYVGKVCAIHPELSGERLITQRKCVACHNLKSKTRHKIKRATDPNYRESNNAYFASYASTRRKIDPEYRAKKIELVSIRKIAKIRRIPPWADLNKIREIYNEARRRGLTVDHIIPLQGKTVSGLHVHNNLQLLPNSANSSKGNSFKG